MDGYQIGLQLGIAGLIVWVVYKVAMKLGGKLIDHWAESEKERNAALSDGFKAIVASVNNHSVADIASHEKVAESHARLAAAVVRVEAKVDTIADYTPVRGVERLPRGKTNG